MESLPGWQPLAQALRRTDVPKQVLEEGALGAILQQGELVHRIVELPPGVSETAVRGGQLDPESGPLEVAYTARVGASNRLQPAILDDAARNHPERMVVSIVVDPGDLDGPTGVHKLYTERLEYPALVDFFEGGEEVLSARVGFKLHGGSSRRPGLQHSYRLHFNGRFGPEQVSPGLLYDGTLDPVRTLVLRRVPLGHFTSSFSYDLASMIGCFVPARQPVQLYMNGVDQGIYLATEHLSREQISIRMGWNRFLLFRRRGLTDEQSRKAYLRLRDWILDQGQSLRAEQVAQYIDLDALTSHLLTVAFCGTSDWEQGAAILNLDDPNARWRWILWDMDRGLFHSRMEGRLPSLGRILDDPQEGRDSVPALVGRSLLRHDPAYQDRFRRFATETLNHVWTSKRLLAIADHYDAMAKSQALLSSTNTRRRQFIRSRPGELMQDMRKLMGLPPVLGCLVTAGQDAEAVLRVNGREVELPFRGLYFTGDHIEVEAQASRPVVAWHVDGKRVPGEKLSLEIQSATRVLPLWH